MLHVVILGSWLSQLDASHVAPLSTKQATHVRESSEHLRTAGVSNGGKEPAREGMVAGATGPVINGIIELREGRIAGAPGALNDGTEPAREGMVAGATGPVINGIIELRDGTIAGAPGALSDGTEPAREGMVAGATGPVMNGIIDPREGTIAGAPGAPIIDGIEAKKGLVDVVWPQATAFGKRPTKSRMPKIVRSWILKL